MSEIEKIAIETLEQLVGSKKGNWWVVFNGLIMHCECPQPMTGSRPKLCKSLDDALKEAVQRRRDAAEGGGG